MNNSARASHFYARLRRETAKFYVLWYDEREDQTQFSFSELRYRPLEFNPRKNSSTFDSWTMWNNSEEKWQLNQLTNLLCNTLRAEATFSRYELAGRKYSLCSQGNFVSDILANSSLSHTVKPVLGGHPLHLFCCPLNRGVRWLKTMGRNVDTFWAIRPLKKGCPLNMGSAKLISSEYRFHCFHRV